MGIAIGIDLGTTNTVCAVLDGSTPTIITNTDGKRLLPSVVGFKKGKRTIGQTAKRQLELHPKSTIHSIKRFIGRRYATASLDLGMVGYEIRQSQSADCVVVVDDRSYTPQEISAFILREVKNYAEAFLGETVSEAVITVPAYFNDRQRQATKDAGALAGLDILRVINEPTAAALAYTYNKKGQKTIAVYDFGGGTFDVSILHIQNDVARVLSTTGDNTLGGNDIDQALSEWMIQDFEKQNDIDISGDPIAIQRIREAAERAKVDLSTSTSAQVNLPFLFVDANGPKNFQTKITRAFFNELVEPLIDKTVEQCKKALEDAKLDASQIEEVVLVGGSSRIAMVQDKLKEFFPCRLNKSFNPDEVVAIGASIQAATLTKDQAKAVTLLDVTAFSLGIETAGGKFSPLIHRNTTIPFEVIKKLTTTIDNQRTVKIHVLQGEDPLARNNISLGEFELTNIQPAAAKVPQIEIRFSIDSNGMLQVKAKDLRTGIKEEIVIENTDGLSQSALDDLKRQMDSEGSNESSQLKSAIENYLVRIDDILHKHSGEIHKSTLVQVTTFQKKTRAALAKAQDEKLLKQIHAQVQKLMTTLQSQL
ncbi:MAG: molecular chaperone DnaK [Myxococcota bacterium]|nr:molecular chaperone DnaK [Myxococcota bacterium]